jgi:DNA polymerase elongation subunit (family B)
MSETSYISAIHEWDTDQILVWERPIAGGPRKLVTHKAPRYFYVPDPQGERLTITGERVTKFAFDTEDEFKEALKRNRKRFESDIRPLARALMDIYHDRPTPVINYAFLDIEVDYNSKLGFSSPENPYAAINAITIYKSWENRYVTYVVPPKGWKDDGTFQQKIKAAWAEHKLGFEPDVTVCESERDLLLYMLGEIEDADILSGWNSEFFDIPYIIKRLERVLGKRGMQGMCFKGAPPPKQREVVRFGSPAIVFSLSGRSHLDYLDLFKKFTFEGRVSYSLGNIAAEELDIPKLDYEGTLEQLYNRDFVHFTAYNARDVEVLVKLDLKFKLMQLVNQMAHENTVPFEAILGTVRYVETGIMNRAHNVHDLVCTDKVIPETNNKKVEGAIVMTPLAGLHQWLGSVDITSLYPSVIRALNMSVETFVGQFVRPGQSDPWDMTEQLYGEDAWNGINAKDANSWRAETVLGELIMTGAEWHAFIRECGYALSAFGTIFDQSKPGMVADTLTFWFNERKRLQAEKKKYGKLAKEETDPEKKAEYQRQEEHYDLLQLTKKIQLNSTYGALLNEAFRFGRREIGASVTGTGRQISIHMGQTIGELITKKPCKIEKAYSATSTGGGGEYVPGEKTALWRQKKEWDQFKTLSKKPIMFNWAEVESGEDEEEGSGAVYWSETDEIVYGDTDSCYFMTRATNYEDAVARADDIAAKTNATFPEFMAARFNCTGGRELLIKAAREVVAERGLFLHAKKKYTLKVVNLDGVDLRAKPKLKSMGSEIKKADTPKVVQEFLKGLMDLVLAGNPYSDLEKFVNKSRGSLIHRNDDLLSLGVSKQINNLDAFYAAWVRGGKKDGKVRMKDGESKNVPGHVRAAINYNELVTAHDPGGSKLLKSGDKGMIFYLEANRLGLKTVAFPADMMHLPAWFTTEFKIDLKQTEVKMIDAKLVKIFAALGYELPTLQRSSLNKSFTF